MLELGLLSVEEQAELSGSSKLTGSPWAHVPLKASFIAGI